MSKNPPKQDLKDRLSAIQKGAAAPSMVPESPPPPPVRDEIPDLANLMSDRKRYLQILRMVNEYGELAAQKKIVETRQKEISAVMKEVVGSLQVSKADVGDFRVNYFTSYRSSIDSNRLLEKGVQPSVIEYATKSTPVVTLKITMRAEGEE
jgi:hypothetical protein